MRILLPVLAASIFISVVLSRSKGELFCLSLHHIGDCCYIGCGSWWLVDKNIKQGNETTTKSVFQVRILGLRGERLRGRKEMKYLSVSTLNILRELCIVLKLTFDN